MTIKDYKYSEWQKKLKYGVSVWILNLHYNSYTIRESQTNQKQIQHPISGHLHLPAITSPKSSENHIFDMSVWPLLTQEKDGKAKGYCHLSSCCPQESKAYSCMPGRSAMPANGWHLKWLQAYPVEDEYMARDLSCEYGGYGHFPALGQTWGFR